MVERKFSKNTLDGWQELNECIESTDMTPEAAIELLNEITGNNWEEESAHGFADDILCMLLERLGHQNVVEAYHRVHKWYA